MTFWSIHTHSRFSFNDAFPKVPEIVERAQQLGYPALGLTDHGSPAGNVQLYQACRKTGISPLPGIELYTTPDTTYGIRSNQHLTLVAHSEIGYRNLCKIATLGARQSYYGKPRVDWANFAELYAAGETKGLTILTGCFFGPVVTTWREVGEYQAGQLVKALAKWFPRCYVEIQNHGIVKPGQVDDVIAAGMVELAETVGVPYVITQDSHYVMPDHKPYHDFFKGVVSWGEDPDDAAFPGIGYWMVDDTHLKELFEPAVHQASDAALAELAEAACVRIPELDDFLLKVPDVTLTGKPMKELRERIETELARRDLVQRYADRASSELAIIEGSGFAGMLMLVSWVCDQLRARNIWFKARGSVSGSLVCYLLGITQVDPVAWKLRFDRFLSADRTRPPDIDLDVQHDRRDEIAELLRANFAVTQVGTHMQYSLDESEEFDDAKGSLLRRYYASTTKRGMKIKNWSQIAHDERRKLRKISEIRPIGQYGTHAAGFVVAPNEKVLAQLPQAYISSSKTFISAYGKKDLERCGFVKLDVLGLRDITGIRYACDQLGITPEDIPLNDPAVFRMIAKGATEGVFQLQGKAMTRGCRDLRPTKITDIAAAQALFRPATMNSGSTRAYLERRRKEASSPQYHADIMAETQETYAVLLYQEQVIGVLRRMGMQGAELTDMLDAVKASNEYVAGARVELEAAKPRIRELAFARGWNETDIKWLLDAISAFADYSFNKAHAVAYGVAAYQSAWVKLHYPQAFWAGLMYAYINHDKEPFVIRAARRDVKLWTPHVNRSGVYPKIEGDGIRKGLLSVKGVGTVAAAELAAKAPYSSLRDLGERVVPRRCAGARKLALGGLPQEAGGVIAALAESGALDGLDSGWE